MKVLSRKAREDISLWKGRIKAAQMMFGRAMRERDKFVRALALSDGVRNWANYQDIESALRGDAYGQQSIPLSYRYAVWLQSQTTSEPPVVRYPRGAAGDEQFAVAIQELLLRVFTESGSLREWNQAIFDICGTGAGCIWYGFHADVAGMEEVAGASEGTEETVQRALMGDVEAKPGQDSAMAARGLDAALTDPVNRVAMPIEAQVSLAMAAGEQDKQALAEAKSEQDVRVRRREIWARRLAMGSWLLWDHTVSDLRDARWMARKIVMTQDQAKASKRIAGGAKSRMELTKPGSEEMYEFVRDVDDKPMDGPENGRMVMWEVWDKQAGTVHLVSSTMDEYLEADEAYPYPNQITGEPAIPGFFPCVVATPIQHGLDIPERTIGVPLISPGYPLQVEIVRLHDFAMESVKRHSARMYEIPAGMDPDLRAQIESGQDALTIERPPEVEPGKTVMPIQFSGEAYKIIDLINRLTAEWAMVQGFPMADLTSMPQADTATAEQLSVSAGRSQADYILNSLADFMAKSMEIIRAMLSIGLYPPEKIAALMGPGQEAIVAAWQATSLDGDRLVCKLASKAKADQVVRIKQLGEALPIAMNYSDPTMPGLPKYDATPIIEELFLALDVGRLRPIQWTQEMLMQRMALSGATGGPEGGGGEGQPGKGGPDEREKKQGPPSNASQNVAARREGR